MDFMKLSQAELSSGQLAPETLAQAVSQVKLHGFVVLENVLPLDLVDELRADFLQTVDELLKTNAEKTEVNTSAFRKNRIRMDLPFRDPYTKPQVITNPFALPIVEQIIGQIAACFISRWMRRCPVRTTRQCMATTPRSIQKPMSSCRSPGWWSITPWSM